MVGRSTPYRSTHVEKKKKNARAINAAFEKEKKKSRLGKIPAVWLLRAHRFTNSALVGVANQFRPPLLGQAVQRRGWGTRGRKTDSRLPVVLSVRPLGPP